MAFMEFHRQNLLNTTTMVTTTAGTGAGTIAYAFDRNLRLGYSTVGYNSSTIAAFSIVFPQTTYVSHILLQNHNLRQFRVYPNSNTAAALAMVAGNSATSTYLSFATTACMSIDIEMELQQTGGVPASNTEKFFGELVVGERLLVVERNPSVDDWNPTNRRKQIITEMPDGGVKVFQVRDKFSANLKWSFISQTFQDRLYSLWSSAAAMYFVPFPTTTGWNGNAYEAAWVGDFDFNYVDNAKSAGYVGAMALRETAGG